MTIKEHLSGLIGEFLAEKELANVIKSAENLTPDPGLFLESISASDGLYILIAGKVRLVNSSKDLITTLHPNQLFGECTLFPKAGFLDYAVRVSPKAELCYIPGKVLRSLIHNNSKFREYLYNLATAKDNEQKSKFPNNNQPTLSVNADQEQIAEISTIKDEIYLKTHKQKVNKAYFPSPTQRVTHLWQHITRRYPFFEQQSGSDCGAACLGRVARYWGKKFSVNRIRDIANVDANGASLRGLSSAAESIGFSTRPVKASIDQLAKQKLPAIAHWEGKHYIVVYEITPNTVIVADPAIGQRSLTYPEFQTGWPGYTLLLQPTALIKELKNHTTPFWQFFNLASPHGQVLLEVFK